MAALLLGGHTIWMQATDPLQTFRATVLAALVAIVLQLRQSEIRSAIDLPYGLILALAAAALVAPPMAVVLIAALAWAATGRLAAVAMALLLLPLDPWFASQLQWPLQVATAELAGLLSGIDPGYDLANSLSGDTVFLPIPCAEFCPIVGHNAGPGLPGYEPFRINEQCAGLNQVEGLLALTAAILLLLGPKLTGRQDLGFLAVAPLLAIIVNGVRVAVSVWLGRWAGRGPWEGWLHDLPTYPIFALAVFGLALAVRRFSASRP